MLQGAEAPFFATNYVATEAATPPENGVFPQTVRGRYIGARCNDPADMGRSMLRPYEGNAVMLQGMLTYGFLTRG